MKRISQDKLAQMVACLVEGAGINATARILKISENAVARNALWLGEACQAYHDLNDRRLPNSTVEADELFSIIHAKQKCLPDHLKSSFVHGEMATWLAIDPVSKFVVSWHIGKHDLVAAEIFCTDMRARLAVPRPTIFSDGLPHYRAAIESAFGTEVNYATINKVLGEPHIFAERIHHAPLMGMRRACRMGDPNMDDCSTTSVERLNLALRMTSARYQRRAYFISKKIRHKRAALALRFMYENYVRVHGSLNRTPAIELGLTTKFWEIEDLVALCPPRPANRPKRYKRRLAA